jgi:hypothetical protein
MHSLVPAAWEYGRPPVTRGREASNFSINCMMDAISTHFEDL